MNRIKTDVLVIGGGAAGIRAAVEAALHGVDVTLVNNAPVSASGSTFSRIAQGWGIQALADDQASTQHIEKFYNEIVSVGQGASDPELVRILVEESGERFNDLRSYGVEFKVNDNGRLFRATGCFSRTERAFITSNFDNLRQSLLSILHQRRVRILTGTVIDLIVSDRICGGAFIFDAENTLAAISAGATVIATGGGGAIYENHLCGNESVGDGYAIAIRAGASLINLEFVQFMLGLKSQTECGFLPRNLLYQEDVLLDGMGKPVLEHHFPDATQRRRAVDLRQDHCPVSTCDDSFGIDLAVWQAMQETGAVFWNADASSTAQTEVVHMAHAFNGGIRIDSRSASNLSGLFAAGEATAGPHGADRIGGCMMTATQVFGQRAGQSAAQHARQMKPVAVDAFSQDVCPALKPGKSSTRETEKLDNLAQTVSSAMNRYAGVVRSESGLKTCRRILFEAACRLMTMEGATRDNYIGYNRVRNMIDVSMQIVKSALRRRTSLGAHCRDDTLVDRQTWKTKPVAFCTTALNPSFELSSEPMVVEWT